MMTFVTRLPREAHNKRWQILAPRGGITNDLSHLQRDIRDGKDEQSITLEVMRDDVYASVRVTPAPDAFRQHERDLTRYIIDTGLGVFLDRNGNETPNMVLAHSVIDTQVTVQGAQTGILIMWNLPDPSDEFPDTKE